MDFKKSDGTRAMGRRKVLELKNRFEELNYDPIKELIEATQGDAIDAKTKMKIHLQLSEYIHPKRRAIDIGSGEEDGIVVTIKNYQKKEAEGMVDQAAMEKELAEDV